jgi:hypothetical protein
MRITIIASTTCAAFVACVVGLGALQTRVAAAQGTAQDVDPKITAFLKPVEMADGDGELKKKLKERHNVAVRLLEERVSEYKRGVRDASFVFDAARLTAEAKLDLADTAEARGTVLEQTLDIAKIIEAHLQQQLDKGFGSKGDLERARLGRLGVEIQILKSKQ